MGNWYFKCCCLATTVSVSSCGVGNTSDLSVQGTGVR